MPASSRPRSMDAEITALSVAPREALIGRWQAVYGCPPPTGVRTDLLVASAAWHLQARRLGGLSRDGRRRLAREIARIEERLGSEAELGRISDGGNADVSDGTARATGASDAAQPSLSLRGAAMRTRERTPVLPGARLIRDWNGTTHVVDVTEGGFLYGGETYRSLSVIARTITGARWSGPRFFGL